MAVMTMSIQPPFADSTTLLEPWLETRCAAEDDIPELQMVARSVTRSTQVAGRYFHAAAELTAMLRAGVLLLLLLLCHEVDATLSSVADPIRRLDGDGKFLTLRERAALAESPPKQA